MKNMDIREDKMSELPLAKIEVIDHGICVDHNFPCPICGKKTAVFQMNNGIYTPCWECQTEGYMTLKLPVWLAKWIRRHRKFGA